MEETEGLPKSSEKEKSKVILQTMKKHDSEFLKIAPRPMIVNLNTLVLVVE